VLAIHMPLGSVAKKGGFQVFLLQTRIRQSSCSGLTRERLNVLVQMPTKGRHTDTDHIDIFHLSSPWQVSCNPCNQKITLYKVVLL
jgi:hypothetical protein